MDDLAQLSAAGSSRSCALWGAAGTPTGAAGTQADVATGLAAASAAGSAAGSAASLPTRADSFGREPGGLGDRGNIGFRYQPARLCRSVFGGEGPGRA
jgi:hypothetical protein